MKKLPVEFLYIIQTALDATLPLTKDTVLHDKITEVLAVLREIGLERFLEESK